MRRLSLVLLLGLAGCAANSGPDQTQAGLDVQALNQMRQELLQPGTGDQKSLRQQAEAFFATPEGRAVFFETVSRSKISEMPTLISLAGFSHDPKALAFVSQQAMQVVPVSGEEPVNPSAPTIDVETLLRNAIIAGAIIVKSFATTPGASRNEVSALLATADAFAAQVAAVDLYSRGLLTAEDKQILEARGIYHNFRKHSDAERTRLMTPNPGTPSPDRPQKAPWSYIPPPTYTPWGTAAPIEGAPIVSSGGGLGASATQVTTVCATPTDTAPWAADHQDNFYRDIGLCNQNLVNDAWKRFHMGEGDWEDFGYGDPCNNLFGLARTLNGIGVLNWAGTTTPTCNFRDKNVLNWASCYSGSEINHLAPYCNVEEPRFIAMTSIGIQWDLDNKTALYRGFFYQQEVEWRAATLFHEARHADGWCTHNDSCRAGENACDAAYEGGCTGPLSSDGHGAYGYTVIYHSWFANSARPEMTNTTITPLAVADGNDRLGMNFEINPCFLLDANGVTFRTCPDEIEVPPPIPSGPF